MPPSGLRTRDWFGEILGYLTWPRVVFAAEFVIGMIYVGVRASRRSSDPRSLCLSSYHSPRLRDLPVSFFAAVGVDRGIRYGLHPRSERLFLYPTRAANFSTYANKLSQAARSSLRRREIAA